MAIGCTINETQFLYAYDYINSAIKAKLDVGNTFDVSEFMRYFYNTVQEVYQIKLLLKEQLNG